MVSITAIGTYIPEKRNQNAVLADKFGFAPDFLETKIGVFETSEKRENEETSDMAVSAVRALQNKLGADFSLDTVQCVVVVTQNPDGKGLPHTSAIVHKKLGLPRSCFAFDISLGCSGFVAGLAIVTGFMSTARLKTGLLITADPYSKIVDRNDRNTALLFGDAATATLLSDEGGLWTIGECDFGTLGESSEALHVKDDNKLSMNGRAVFDFSVMNVPKSVARTLEANHLTIDDIDLGILHPGSKYIVDTIANRLKLKAVARGCEHYGNTVSSSIPLLLEPVDPGTTPNVLACGFGVGLGWATTILRSAK